MQALGRGLIAFMIITGLYSCDRFVTYHLLVKDAGNKPLPATEVEEIGHGFSQQTDSGGQLELSKITGGIKPDLSKKVRIHKDGYRDTIVNLKPDGQTIVQIQTRQ